MATINVSLPDLMKEWMEAQERADRIDALQRLVGEGLESGVSSRSKADLLEAARKRAAVTRDA